MSTKFEQKINSGVRGRVSEVADLGSKICQKMPFSRQFGWAICIGSNLDDEQAR